jgi:hypothetical protein
MAISSVVAPSSDANRAAEKPDSPFLSLQRDEAVRQLALKQRIVEVIVGLLQFRVGLVCWSC